MLKIYTGHGDTGQTGLLYGGRVSKADLRCEAYGTTDEVVSVLGLARSLSTDQEVQEVVKQVQVELFTVGAELATDTDKYDTMQKHFAVKTSQNVDLLERTIDELQLQVKLPRSFIVPGGSPASAALDVARSTVRRAERRVVGLKEANLLVNVEIIRYLNRVADLLFMLARYEDRALPMELLSNTDN